MKLYVLGTGAGSVTKCYNTCWCLENNDKYFLVDGGGGNQILSQLEKSKIDICKIHDIFISHIHTDHILGLIWVIRAIVTKIRFSNTYDGVLNVYGNDESIQCLRHLVDLLFPPCRPYLDSRVNFIVVENNETRIIADLPIRFFDICARKEKQYGFMIENFLAFCGDEPLNLDNVKIGSVKWLMHEAFCLDSESETFNPHKKGHCTVKECAETASIVGAENLIIWHTVDNLLDSRKTNYTQEANRYFSGNVIVPDDLEIIDL